ATLRFRLLSRPIATASLSPALPCRAATAKETPTTKRSKTSRTPSSCTLKTGSPTVKRSLRSLSASRPSKLRSDAQAAAAHCRRNLFGVGEAGLLSCAVERQSHYLQEFPRQTRHSSVPRWQCAPSEDSQEHHARCRNHSRRSGKVDLVEGSERADLKSR